MVAARARGFKRGRQLPTPPHAPALALRAGFYTCESLLMQPKKALAAIKGLSEAKIDKMLGASARAGRGAAGGLMHPPMHRPPTNALPTHRPEAARKVCPTGFITAKQYEEKREREFVRLSTGCAALDEMLGGGVETKAITE